MAKDGKNPLPNPPPEGEGANEKGTIQFLVAYRDGPPEIGFAGRQWQRGVAQLVMTEEWAAMQERADFNEYQFTKEN